MADSVIVNGVSLTRAQVEDAMKRLNEPAIVPGDIVRIGNNSTRGLVLSDASDTARLLRRHYRLLVRPGHAMAIGLDGCIGACLSFTTSNIGIKISNIKTWLG